MLRAKHSQPSRTELINGSAIPLAENRMRRDNCDAFTNVLGSHGAVANAHLILNLAWFVPIPRDTFRFTQLK